MDTQNKNHPSRIQLHLVLRIDTTSLNLILGNKKKKQINIQNKRKSLFSVKTEKLSNNFVILIHLRSLDGTNKSHNPHLINFIFF